MSTPPGAATSARAPRENVFTHRIGPLPMWGWLGIVGAAIVAWAWYQNRNQTLTTQPSNTSNASQVPQFVNQTYVTANPPSTPGTTGGTVMVPNVVGMTDAAADTAITAAGLKVTGGNEPKGGVGQAGNNPAYKVTGQSPAGGAMVAPGSGVTLTFSTPPASGGKKPAGPPVKPKKPAKKPDKGES